VTHFAQFFDDECRLPASVEFVQGGSLKSGKCAPSISVSSVKIFEVENGRNFKGVGRGAGPPKRITDIMIIIICTLVYIIYSFLTYGPL